MSSSLRIPFLGNKYYYSALYGVLEILKSWLWIGTFEVKTWTLYMGTWSSLAT